MDADNTVKKRLLLKSGGCGKMDVLSCIERISLFFILFSLIFIIQLSIHISISLSLLIFFTQMYWRPTLVLPRVGGLLECRWVVWSGFGFLLLVIFLSYRSLAFLELIARV